MTGSNGFNALTAVLLSVRQLLIRNKGYLTGLNTLLILMLSLAFASQKKGFEPVVFSQGLAIASFAKELNDKGVSAEQQRLLVNRLVSAMPKALARYAGVHHVVILNDKEVKAGAPNITPFVLAYVATEMIQQTHGIKSHD